VSVTTTGNVCVGDCAFQITQSKIGATDSIASISADGTNILTAVIAWPGTLSGLVTNTVTNLNANSGTSGYCAFGSGSAIFLSKVTTSSADPEKVVVVTFTTTTNPPLGVSPLGQTPLTANAAPSSVVCTKYGLPVSVTFYSTVAVSCLPAGGVGPYTFVWARKDGDSRFAVSTTTDSFGGYGQISTLQSVYFKFVNAGTGSRIAHYTCVVTDALGSSIETAPVLVSAGGLFS
jgi:hypothetical protein